jgi:hypothetical protein
MIANSVFKHGRDVGMGVESEDDYILKVITLAKGY